MTATHRQKPKKPSSFLVAAAGSTLHSYLAQQIGTQRNKEFLDDMDVRQAILRHAEDVSFTTSFVLQLPTGFRPPPTQCTSTRPTAKISQSRSSKRRRRRRRKRKKTPNYSRYSRCPVSADSHLLFIESRLVSLQKPCEIGRRSLHNRNLSYVTKTGIL